MTYALNDRLCFSLYGASMAVGRLYKPMLDRLGLTYPQYLVLAALWESDELTIGALSARLALEPSNITPLVKRLEAGGFVTRRRNPDDERQVSVSLTKQGWSMREESACLATSLIDAAALSPDRLASLTRDVAALRDAVSEAVGETRR